MESSTSQMQRILMDNDGRHHNRRFKAYIGERGLQKPNAIGFLPANLPDLNPVENIFGVMKNFVYDLNPSTLQELRLAVIDAWESIPNETLRNLFASMPGRMQTVVDKNGDRIKY
jgi:transposase